MVSTELLCSQTELLCEFISETLTKSRSRFAEDPNEFVGRIGGHLGGCMQQYARYLKALDVTSREEVEALFKANFQDKKVQACFDELEEAEEAWNEFVRLVDSNLYKSGGQTKPVEEGKHVPETTTLVNFKEESILLKDLVPSDERPYLHLVLLRHFA